MKNSSGLVRRLAERGLILAAVMLAAACGSERDFFECAAGQVGVDDACRDACTDTCPDGLTCLAGACLPGCGDGVLGSHEECDDGNDEPKDGCAGCRVEAHFACDSEPAPSSCSCERGYQDNDENGSCEESCSRAKLDCGARGVCNDASGTAVCACDEGYQDNDGAGGCLPNCATAELRCGEHAECDDGSGRAECRCDDGFQDHDENGACSEACSSELCGADASCNDATGTARCACNDGFQDRDEDGACQPDCSQLECAAGSRCDDATGVAGCVCNKGYQDYDQDGTCEAGCTKVDCGAHGECDDSSGVVACACADGYQDNDGKSGCAPDCETAALGCGPNSQCSDSSGQARCECNAGYQDNDGKNGCSPNCTQAALGCGIHASCSDASGTAQCVCEPHYVDPGKDGACEQGTCYVTASICGATKICDRAADTCVALPDVPNGDFSCQSGGNCELEWTLTQGFTIGDACGGGLTATRSAFVQPSPGVFGDYYARVTVPIPSYASIDPPTASAGPLAIAFDTGQTCVAGSSGPACPTGAQPSPAIVATLDGEGLYSFVAGTTNDCAASRSVACLGQDAYGHDALLGLRPAAQAAMDAAVPLWLTTFTKIALVRDASCPVPGVVPFAPGDWSGAVKGTPASPYLDLTFAGDCASSSVTSDVSVPSKPAKSVLQLEVTATADTDGVYPQLDVRMSHLDFALVLDSYVPTSDQPSVRRFCVEHSFFGRINQLELEGTPRGSKCGAGAPKLRIQKLSMGSAGAGECP